MDILKLKKKLTKARSWYRLTISEQALYHELIETWTIAGGRRKFTCTNTYLCSRLNISVGTLRNARKTLIRAGLISYQSGKSLRQAGVYSLMTELIPPENGKEEETIPDTIPNPAPQTGSETLSESMVISDNNINTITTTKEIYKERREKFEEFYNLYPGNKRSPDTEWYYFCGLYPGEPECIDLLVPAIKEFIEWRRERLELGIFTPEYPNMIKWLKEKRWETRYEDHNIYY